MEGQEKAGANFNEPPPKYEPPQPGSQYSEQAPGYVPGPQPVGYPPAQPGNYGPYPGYVPGQVVAGQTTVVVQPQLMAINGGAYRYMQNPALIVCQHCQATVTTSLTYEVGLLTYAISGLMCLFGLWLGCCLIPFCIDGTKDVEHRCPNCKQIVGKFRHFS